MRRALSKPVALCQRLELLPSCEAALLPKLGSRYEVNERRQKKGIESVSHRVEHTSKLKISVG